MAKRSLAVSGPESVEVQAAVQPQKLHAFGFDSTHMIKRAGDRLAGRVDAPRDDLVEHQLRTRVGDLEEADERRLEVVMECPPLIDALQRS